MILECLLLSATLCRAIHDKPVVALAAAQSSFSFADGYTTRRMIQRGYSEMDPITRPVIGKKAPWARMAPAGAAIGIGEMWLAEKMRSSSHKWIRKTWWIPQTFTIGGNIYGIRNNVRLLRN